jgi:hypothetical protein
MFILAKNLTPEVNTDDLFISNIQLVVRNKVGRIIVERFLLKGEVPETASVMRNKHRHGVVPEGKT